MLLKKALYGMGYGLRRGRATTIDSRPQAVLKDPETLKVETTGYESTAGETSSAVSMDSGTLG